MEHACQFSGILCLFVDMFGVFSRYFKVVKPRLKLPLGAMQSWPRALRLLWDLQKLRMRPEGTSYDSVSGSCELAEQPAQWGLQEGPLLKNLKTGHIWAVHE